MPTSEEARAKALAHTARMMKTILDEGAVPLIVIAARPEDDTTMVIAWPEATNKLIAKILEETLHKVRLQPERFEDN